MLAIAIRFPAGRYHATPWGRHVNEAAVEWPPSPWRLPRALIATWYNKGDASRYPRATLDALIEELAGELPGYRLPKGVQAHTRHYMPQRGFKSGRIDTSLVFDAFVGLDKTDELIIGWPGLKLEAEQRALLAPLNAAEYIRWRERMTAEHGLDGKLRTKRQRDLFATLPEQLADALRAETGAIQQVGWSRAPGSRFVTYQRPSDAFVPLRQHRPRPVRPVTTVRLALYGKPLPRIEDAVKIGEITRLAAIRAAGQDNAARVPSVISGHDMPRDNRHGHAFYLPEDDDGDGHIDHVLIHAPAGFAPDSLRAFDAMKKLWSGAAGEWSVMLEGYGETADWPESHYLGSAVEWISVTPYLHPWFRKKQFGVEDQIRRECRERGVPEPIEIERIPFLEIHGRQRRPVHFHRFRRKRGLTQPDRQGSFFRLRFPQPLEGPLALGFASHFGLGLFRPLP
ncbi:MAG: type I-U CRISPR-associated protein Csb2 [Halothiobacillaceae bacterium]